MPGIKINEWVGDYYTYGRLNSHGFCMLEDLEHSLDKHQWDKAKAIEYVMWNHNIEKDQATGMAEWAMSMLTEPGFPETAYKKHADKAIDYMSEVTGVDRAELTKPFPKAPEPEAAEVTESVMGLPKGWLLCDGAVLNRGIYEDLFKAIGFKFNTGGEITDHQFRVPDMRVHKPGIMPRDSGIVIRYLKGDEFNLVGTIQQFPIIGKDGK